MKNYVVLLFLILAQSLWAEPADFKAAVDSLDILLQNRGYYQQRRSQSSTASVLLCRQPATTVRWPVSVWPIVTAALISIPRYITMMRH